MNIIDAINNGVTNEITVDPYELHIYEERKINKSVPVDFRIINNKQPISPQDILFIHKDSIETDKILINRILSNKYHPVGSSFIFNDRTFILVDYGDIKTYNGKSYVHALVKDTSNVDEVECIDTTYRERRVIESINNMIVEDNTISSLLEYYNKYDWMNYVSDNDDGVDTKEAYDTLYEIFSVAKTFHKVLYGDIYLSDDIKSKFEDLFINYYTVKLKLGRAEVSVPIKLFVLWLLCKYINAPIEEDSDNICPICEKVLVSYDKTKNLLDNLKFINISNEPFGLCINKIAQDGSNTIEILIRTTDSVECNYLIVLKDAVCDKQELLFDITSSDLKLFKVNKTSDAYTEENIEQIPYQYNDTVDAIVDILKVIIGAKSTNYPYDINELLNNVNN